MSESTDVVRDYSIEIDRRLARELSEDAFLDLLGPAAEPIATARRPRRIAPVVRQQLVLALPDITQLATRAPALDRWRRAVLATATKRRPLEVAAAWELTALECEAAGEVDGAVAALGKARDALRMREVA